MCLKCKIQGAPDNTPEIVPKGELQNLYKYSQKDAPEKALKGALQVALELHLFMQLSMHKRIENDLLKSKIEEACYATLEGMSKISLYGVFKAA